jgi:hypothetical protein
VKKYLDRGLLPPLSHTWAMAIILHTKDKMIFIMDIVLGRSPLPHVKFLHMCMIKRHMFVITPARLDSGGRAKRLNFSSP